MNYDKWKANNPWDERMGPEPPPCELAWRGRVQDHPRYPSGDCVVCGALCTEGCKYPSYEAWEEDQTGEEQYRDEKGI